VIPASAEQGPAEERSAEQLLQGMNVHDKQQKGCGSCRDKYNDQNIAKRLASRLGHRHFSPNQSAPMLLPEASG